MLLKIYANLFIPNISKPAKGDIIMIYRFVWTFWQQRSILNEMKFDVKFCEIEAENFQVTCFMLLA